MSDEKLFNPASLPESVGGTDRLRKNVTEEDVNSLREAYKYVRENSEDWDTQLKVISNRIELGEDQIMNFINNKGVFYTKTISKLAQNFNRVDLQIRSQDELSNCLKLAEYIQFDFQYRTSELPHIKDQIKDAISVLRLTKIQIEEIKNSPVRNAEDILEQDAEIYNLVGEVLNEFEEKSITLLSGLLPRFLVPYENSEALIIVISFLSKYELMKETHGSVRPGTLPEELKYSYMLSNEKKMTYERITSEDHIEEIPLNEARKLVKLSGLNEILTRQNLDDLEKEKIEIKTFLNQGLILAMPTEGCWGLSCDPENQDAVERLCSLKKRNIDQGLILVSSNKEHLLKYFIGLSFEQTEQANSKWPGSHTWLLPANDYVPSWIKGAHSTVALRCSDHPIIKKVTSAFGRPVCTTSANLTGFDEAKTRKEVEAFFGEKVIIIDGELGGLDRPTPMQNLITKEWVRK
tara:strand:+ start:3316 stop:4704 length:1389 start_codon:yes stop_codon:yes gene_type:complete